MNRCINKDFFKEWSPGMAYVLGYFSADGSMYRNKNGSHYLSFYSNDKGLLEKVKEVMRSNHKIGERKIDDFNPNIRYTLQIGSREMYEDLLNLGMKTNKSLDMVFPCVPQEYLGDFVRGYFDGDGTIACGEYIRRNRNNQLTPYFMVKFSSGSGAFLEGLRKALVGYAGIGRGSLFRAPRAYVLSYSKYDGMKLCKYMYKNSEKELYLKRKYDIYSQVINPRGGSIAG